MPSITTLYPHIGNGETSLSAISVAVQAKNDAVAAAEDAQEASASAVNLVGNAVTKVSTWEGVITACLFPGNIVHLEADVEYTANAPAIPAAGVALYLNGASIVSGYSSYSSSNDIIRITNINGQIVDGGRFSDDRATVLGARPACSAFVKLNRGTPASGVDPYIYKNKKVIIKDNFFIGALS